jgi:hypothetical protein
VPPELETFDQLLSGDLPISVIRRLFDNSTHFTLAIEAMLGDAEIRLLTSDGSEVPKWQWRDVLVAVTADSGECSHVVSITDKGAQRIA